MGSKCDECPQQASAKLDDSVCGDCILRKPIGGHCGGCRYSRHPGDGTGRRYCDKLRRRLRSDIHGKNIKYPGCDRVSSRKETTEERLKRLEKLLGNAHEQVIEVYDGWPITGLSPGECESALDEVILVSGLEMSEVEYDKHVDEFRKQQKNRVRG